jgi:hypothetical protein
MKNRVGGGTMMQTITLDYPVTPKCRPVESSVGGRKVLRLIENGRARYRDHLSEIRTMESKLSKIPLSNDDPFGPSWRNDMFPGLDGAFLYTSIVRGNPRRYIEIGSGSSTKFARQAIKDFGLRTKIVSIDPEPRADIDRLCDEVIRAPFESVDGRFFENMSSDDIFFLDGSHRSLQSSDVTVFFTEHLSGLPAGMLYGIHDIFLPYDYPDAWIDRYYSEQYVLAAYLLGGADGDLIEFPGFYISTAMKQAAALFDWDKSGEIERHAGGFWMRRNSREARKRSFLSFFGRS